MMAKVADLQAQLAEKPSNEVYEARIEELESLLEDLHQKHATRTFLNWVTDIVFYLIVPLLLLLLAHWLITVVYDTKMLYLRIVSIALPLPFAYFLFKSHSHKLLPWFVGVVFLALASVIGMSWITSLVDHSPVWPQNLFEWKEVIQYATSIAFSFLTGMLLGRIAYNAKQKRKKVKLLKSSLLSAPLNDATASLEDIHGVMKTLQEYGGTIVALGTTAVSIYTGLKGIIGS